MTINTVYINKKRYIDVSSASDSDKAQIEKSTTDVVSNEDYFVCDCCDRYVFINDGYVQFKDIILCPDCMRDMTVDSPYFKEYLDMIINNPKFADKYLTHTLLKSLGFKRTPHFYKDNPEKILNKYNKQGYDVIFRIYEQYGFEFSYYVYIAKV